MEPKQLQISLMVLDDTSDNSETSEYLKKISTTINLNKIEDKDEFYDLLLPEIFNELEEEYLNKFDDEYTHVGIFIKDDINEFSVAYDKNSIKSIEKFSLEKVSGISEIIKSIFNNEK